MTHSPKRADSVLSRRNFIRTAAVGAGALTLAACGGESGSSGSAADDQSSTGPSSASASTSSSGSAAESSSGSSTKASEVSGSLTVAVFGTNQDQIASFKSLFKKFEDQHPNVTLKVRGIAASNWGSYFDTVSTQVAAGSAPDVVQVATEGLRLFSSQGLVTPLDSYIQRDKARVDEFLNDVDQHFQDQVNKYENKGGHTYYLPGSFNTMCMWCNVDMFRKAGLDEPQDGWTWDDFRSACKKLKRLPDDIIPYTAAGGGANYFTGIEPWLLSNAANTLDESWTTATMDKPEAIEAVAFNRQLVKDGYTLGPGTKVNEVNAVANGKAAMVGGGRWPISPMRSGGHLSSLKIVSWPKKAKKGTPVGWNCYPILDSSANKDAAWEFLLFMHSEAAEKAFAKGGGTIVPARKSVALSSSFLKDSPKNSEELYNSLSYATVIPSPNKNNVVAQDIIDSLKQMLTGNVEVADGCKKLNASIQKEL